MAGKSYGSRRVNLCIDRPANSKECILVSMCMYVCNKIMILCVGVFCPRDPIRLRRKADGYNVALTGSTAEALKLQFIELKKRVEEDKNIFPRDGKILLILLIGANDLCMWDCHRPLTQLSSFRQNLIEFLDNVYEYFGEEKGWGRLDVLIGEIPALEGVPERAKGTGMEAFAVLECPCAYSSRTGEYSFVDRIEVYNEFIRSLPFSHYPSPFIKITNVLREEELKNWPKEMTSKLDAFHPSKWAQEYFAKKIYFNK